MSGPTVVIEEFIAQTAPETVLEQRYELSVAIDQELDPDDPVKPLAMWRRELVESPSWSKPLRWLARDQSGRIIGAAVLGLAYTESNRHLAHFYIEVAADARRQAVGLRLLEPIAAAAAADGRTILGAGAAAESAGAQFLQGVGMEQKLVDRRSRLKVGDVDPAMVQQWIEQAQLRAAGYSLLIWDTGTPPEYLEKMVRLEHVMNTAPRDDLEMDDWVTTPERYSESEQRAIGQGHRWWTILARHDETDELVGFTTIAFQPHEHDIAWQEGTAVDPAHRNHGIGRWLKAAMLQKLVAEKPEIWRIDTWNAGSNKTMLDINVALGFRPVKHYGSYQAPTEKLAAAVAERLG